MPTEGMMHRSHVHFLKDASIPHEYMFRYILYTLEVMCAKSATVTTWLKRTPYRHCTQTKYVSHKSNLHNVATLTVV